MNKRTFFRVRQIAVNVIVVLSILFINISFLGEMVVAQAQEGDPETPILAPEATASPKPTEEPTTAAPTPTLTSTTVSFGSEPSLSVDGLIAYNAAPLLVVVDDPNPDMKGIKLPLPELNAMLADPSTASAIFSITYVSAGSTDPLGQPCTTFPASAKTAFNAAAAIWANTIQSSVPITIRACWASLPNPNTLGYSGFGSIHRDFLGAPRANTWYSESLANSLYGSDLSTNYDMHITYNSNFSWYYGTDANPPAGQHDLVTVAAHEIAHGLNFAGSVSYSEGTGSYGYSGYPMIYDTFMEDGSGTKLTSYTSPSTSLGTLLTSGNLWFNGSNANAANGGSRVKMYAPGTWTSGSSYYHLDYSTFAGTINSMMVYAIGAGSANHNPGPVTTGLLNDLGWTLASPEMDVQGNGVSITDGDSAPEEADDTDFGNVDVNGGTVAHTFTIENTGDADLNLTNTPKIEITGTHAADFTVTAQPTSPVVNGGGTTTFEVTFDPWWS